MSAFWARWTTSPTSCGARTCSCCRPRPSPLGSPRTAACLGTSGCTRTCCVIDLLRLVRAHNLLIATAAVLAGGWIALASVQTPKVLAFAALAAVGIGMAGYACNDIWDQAADRVNRSGTGRPLATGRISRGAADLCVAAGAFIGLTGAALVSGVLAAAFVPLSLALPAAAHYHGPYFLIALFAQLAVLAVASRLFIGRAPAGGNSRLLKGAMLVGIVALVAGRVA